ncbi:MAG: hypothetical protein KI793_04890 [Rivularia sp. (in: Bacteria)]|nr:hypothetical protein [Rivularia sp. MS3]
MNFLSFLIPSALAHKTEVSQDVGATLHIEPDDTPRAGEAAQTWFALTRKGGKVIPLKECDCQLAVYSEPRKATAEPLAQPSLEPVSAERYQGIPGTKITFPKPGAYKLELSGKPANDDSFKPFTLKFDVTVAAGTNKSTNQSNNNQQETQTSQEIKNVNTIQTEEQTFPLPIWAIGLGALVIIGGIFAVMRRGRS